MSWLIDLFKEIPLSSVLKEKLATADDRIKTLEAENATLREKDSNSQIRIHQLEEQVAVVEREKNQLQAETYKTKELSHKLLDDPKVEILKALSRSRELSIGEFMEMLGASETTVKYHLNWLTNELYINMPNWGDVYQLYTLRDKGITYLVEHDLA